MAVADVSGDGKLDLIVANYDAGTVSVLPGNGDGSFQPQRIFSGRHGANALVVADLNNDTRPDIVTANYESNNVSVLMNSGMGAFCHGQELCNLGCAGRTGRHRLPKRWADGYHHRKPGYAITSAIYQGSAVTARLENTARLLVTGRGPIALAAADVSPAVAALT